MLRKEISRWNKTFVVVKLRTVAVRRQCVYASEETPSSRRALWRNIAIYDIIEMIDTGGNTLQTESLRKDGTSCSRIISDTSRFYNS